MAEFGALRRGGFVPALMLGLATLASSAFAQDSEQAFFAGKTVRFVVGFGPGGGYDAYARMLAPYLSKNLGATVIVENRPGAGGLVALNGVYMAPPDGLTIMIVNGTGAAFSQLTDEKGARYDLGKIGYVATLSAPPSLWTVGPHFGVKTIGEALKANKKWRWAASGPVDSLSDGAAFTCEALKLDCQIVLGYKGSNDAALAVSRGEMDALYVTDTSANHYAAVGRAYPARNDRPRSISILSGTADHLRGSQSQHRSEMAVRLSARGAKSGPYPGGPARNDRQPAGFSGSRHQEIRQRSQFPRGRRKARALHRLCGRCRHA